MLWMAINTISEMMYIVIDSICFREMAVHAEIIVQSCYASECDIKWIMAARNMTIKAIIIRGLYRMGYVCQVVAGNAFILKFMLFMALKAAVSSGHMPRLRGEEHIIHLGVTGGTE